MDTLGICGIMFRLRLLWEVREWCPKYGSQDCKTKGEGFDEFHLVQNFSIFDKRTAAVREY